MSKKNNLLRDFICILLGALFYAVSTHCFIVPANIAPGGAMGIALMMNHLTGFPVGTLTLLVNLPLLVLACLFLSRKFAAKTAVTCLICSFVLDVCIAPFLPIYEGDRLLCSLYGGVLVGIGMALIFLGGSTTGGSDIAGYLMQKSKPHLSIGRALMMIDGVVLVVSIFVFENIDAALFGLVTLYAQNKVIDGIIYGNDIGTNATVITSKPEPIVQEIIRELDRSATILPAVGGYSKKEMSVLLCTVRKAEFAKLKKIVHECDENAFVMVSEAIEVFGLGFKDFNNNP